MRQNIEASQLSEPSLESVPVSRSPATLPDDNANSWMSQRGSDCSDVKELRPSTLPLSQNRCQLRLTRQAMGRRKTKFVRRWRTLRAVER